MARTPFSCTCLLAVRIVIIIIFFRTQNSKQMKDVFPKTLYNSYIYDLIHSRCFMLFYTFRIFYNILYKIYININIYWYFTLRDIAATDVWRHRDVTRVAAAQCNGDSHELLVALYAVPDLHKYSSYSDAVTTITISANL